mmetsp:Transcript_14629/g.27419  ORF Transcript_14629/g.27419 Transcript_14629/m.27419 type:complete len:153 (-) Transcript_14629:379-837(-)
MQCNNQLHSVLALFVNNCKESNRIDRVNRQSLSITIISQTKVNHSSRRFIHRQSIMLQRTRVLLSKATKRTVVRDPRKIKVPSSAASSTALQETYQQQEHLPSQHHQPQTPSLPFEPSPQNQQSIGSSMASYALAGVGVALGFTFVGLLFGG